MSPKGTVRQDSAGAHPMRQFVISVTFISECNPKVHPVWVVPMSAPLSEVAPVPRSVCPNEHEIKRAKAFPHTAAAIVVGMESLVRLVPGPARGGWKIPLRMAANRRAEVGH